jgi:hypothetical protein
MSYLFKEDYARFIYEVLKNNLSSIQISDYFSLMFKNNIEDNIGFERELKDVIEYTIDKRDKIQRDAAESVRLSGGIEFYDGADGKVQFHRIFSQPDETTQEMKYDEYITMSFEDSEKIREGYKIFLNTIRGKDVENVQSDNDWKKYYKEFKNNFDKVEPSVVFKHFYNGLVKTKCLDTKSLNEYLKLVFEDADKRQKFKLKDTGKKQKVINVFYKYYKDVSLNIHGKQRRYAELLGEYFEGYNTNDVYTNFSK